MRRMSIPLVLSLLLPLPMLAQERSPNHRDRAGDSGRSRHSAPRDDEHRRGRRPERAAVFPFEFRTIDGHGNNLRHPERGAAEVPFLRLVDADYTDGAAAPSGAMRPGARAVSNAVSAQSASMPNAAGASDYLWQWGQFLDHDIDETPLADPAEAFDIEVPMGDPFFDPLGTGTATIPLSRSSFETVDGVRQQVNLITAFIDASNVYGSDEARAAALRTLDGSGRLRTSDGDLLPFNESGLPNAPSTAPTFFLAGDIRANEQVGLTAMHTLFVREHNFWADRLTLFLGPGRGELVYQVARAIVAAEMQAITYREFLPLLLGRPLPRYRGYHARVDAGISNLFATAAYRVGHTMLSPDIQRAAADGTLSPLPLAQAFFDPGLVSAEGIDPVLRGLALQAAQTIDTRVVDDVRNFLFGPPGAGGFDLVSLNLQRGRDHGLPDYNAVRQAFGRPAVTDFEDFAADRVTATALASVYASPDEVDAWIGLLAEPAAPGALVGRTLRRVLRDQFRRLRDGDRFWYEAYLPREMVRFVEEQTLAVIIRRNTGIGEELADDVFRTP